METDEQEFSQESAETGPRILRSRVIPSPAAAKSFFKEMDRKKKFEFGLLLFLLPLFFYLAWANLFSKPIRSLEGLPSAPPKIGAISRVEGLSSVPSRSLAGSLAAVQKDAAFSKESELEEERVRNPFSLLPVGEKPETPQRPLLQGTVISPDGKAYAILNNKVVKAGDEMADNQIESVGDGFVILRTPEGDRVRLDTSF